MTGPQLRILGIDPGTRVVGWGMVRHDGSRIVAVGHGTVSPGRSLSYPQRLRVIFEGVRDHIAEHQPDAVAVEKVFAGKNVSSALKIGEGRAVVLLAAALAGLPVAEYAPAVVKKSVVGSGAAHKSQVAEMVRVVLGLAEVPTPDDASDALAIAICHCHRREHDPASLLGRAR